MTDLEKARQILARWCDVGYTDPLEESRDMRIAKQVLDALVVSARVEAGTPVPSAAPVSGPATAAPIPHVDALDDIGSDGSFLLEDGARAKAVPAVGEQQILDEACRRYDDGRFQRCFAEGTGWGLKNRSAARSPSHSYVVTNLFKATIDELLFLAKKSWDIMTEDERKAMLRKQKENWGKCVD